MNPKALTVLVIVALAACGGGGSSGGSLPPTSSNPTSASLTASGSSNATASPIVSPTPNATATVLLTIQVPQCQPGKLIPITITPMPNAIGIDPTCNVGANDPMSATSDNPSIVVQQEPQPYNPYVFVPSGHGANITITDQTTGAAVTVSY